MSPLFRCRRMNGPPLRRRTAACRKRHGKVPLPGAHANAPPGGSAASDTGKQRLVSITVFLAQVSAASAASECEGIILLQQNNEEHRDEAERSERSPLGVARNAGVEGVDGCSPASKRRSRARERKCFATGPASATGEGGRGTCATSPGAIRKSKVPCSLPSGHLTCSCAQAKQSLRTPCLLLRQ